MDGPLVESAKKIRLFTEIAEKISYELSLTLDRSNLGKSSENKNKQLYGFCLKHNATMFKKVLGMCLLLPLYTGMPVYAFIFLNSGRAS